MVSVTCYGGVDEIGGNKIIVQDDDTCFSLDFGTSLGRRQDYFEEYLKPRPGMGLLDLLYMELIPPLEGIYRQDLVPSSDFWAQWRSAPHYRRLTLDCVLLSHAHVDHSGYISFLEPEIPVCSTVMTAFISKAMQDSGQADFEREVCYANLRAPQEGILRASRISRQRPFMFLDGMPSGSAALSFWNSIPKKKEVSVDQRGCPAGQDRRSLLPPFPCGSLHLRSYQLRRADERRVAGIYGRPSTSRWWTGGHGTFRGRSAETTSRGLAL